MLDIYHAAQHVHACGKTIFGEKNPAARNWSDAQLRQLIEQGGPAFCDHLQQRMLEQTDPAATEAIASLKTYLDDNRDRMWYRRRLTDGRPIGSGLIEGGCKNTLGARLKLNAARWRPRRAERMGHLRCLRYSDLWATYWDTRAA